MSYELHSVDPEERVPLHGRREGLRRRPLLSFSLVVLVMAVFAGGLWLAYRAGARRDAGPVPLIRAERGPAKVRPSSPGGLQVPDQNMLIFNEGRPRIERLLPGPEEPMARPGVKPAAAVAPPAPTPQAAPSPAAPALPRAAGASAPPVQAETRIQLGALRSKAAARIEWQRLKRANPDILGPLSAATVRADLGEKGTYYRLEAGPFASAAEALRICGELKRRNIGCLLVR